MASRSIAWAMAWRNFSERNQSESGVGALQLKNRKLYSRPGPASRASRNGVCARRAKSSGRNRVAPQDLARAYSWFAIAAARGVFGAAEGRDETARKMSAEQVQKASQSAANWMKLHPKPASE